MTIKTKSQIRDERAVLDVLGEQELPVSEIVLLAPIPPERAFDALWRLKRCNLVESRWGGSIEPNALHPTRSRRPMYRRVSDGL
jgi:hypothetical protein